MFIELHNTDGDPFLLNVDEIESVRQGDGYHAVIGLRCMTYGNVISQESYEDIRRALPGEITLVGTQSEKKDCLSIKTYHKCSSCGRAWTGYFDVCPKCGTLNVPF